LKRLQEQKKSTPSFYILFWGLAFFCDLLAGIINNYASVNILVSRKTDTRQKISEKAFMACNPDYSGVQYYKICTEQNV